MIRIATRRSPLARWQADWVAQRLRDLSEEVQIVLLSSQGDVDRTPIDGSQSVGLFTKRIQQAVLEGEAEVAVHSLKDLPTQLDTGMRLAAVPTRAAAADCLVTLAPIPFDELRPGARIGTGSRRRMAQLLSRRPDLRVEAIRGNVQTRLSKLTDEGFDAIVLAQAGLERLSVKGYAIAPLSTEWMVPAPGQGALGVEVRNEDARAAEIVARLDCAATHACVAAERAVLRQLRAGCLAPVAALGEIAAGWLTLRAVVLSVDGSTRLVETQRIAWSDQVSLADADALGVDVARRLVEQGAEPLVAASR